MLSRLLGATLMAAAVLAVALPAKATTITPGGSVPADTINTFDANPGPLGSQVSFTHDYTFTGVGSLASSALVTVLLPFPNPPSVTGQPGIANLVISWLKTDLTPLASLTLTNASGQTLAFTFDYTFGLITDAVLRLTGTTLKSDKKAFYDLTLTFSRDSNTDLPLPPALLLFGSALVGMTVLGRRKRKGAAA
jgi:hypothetical protein